MCVVWSGFHLSGTVKDNNADGLYSEQERHFRVSVNFDRYFSMHKNIVMLYVTSGLKIS